MSPTLLSLADWGGTANGWPSMTLPATDLWVHHSVTNEDIGVHPTDDAKADFLELDSIGLSRGHGGISYSHAIHPSGVIGEGQGTRRGAHTAGDGCNHSPWGWNPCSFGVVFIGDYTIDTLTSAAVSSFQWLRDKLITDGVLVAGVYPTGGHLDAPGNQTACPGTNIESQLAVLRAPSTGGFLMALTDAEQRFVYETLSLLRDNLNPSDRSTLPENVGPMADLWEAAKKILAGTGGPGGGLLTEADVRRIVREEIDRPVRSATVPIA